MNKHKKRWDIKNSKEKREKEEKGDKRRYESEKYASFLLCNVFSG